jgi:hypothetical protein
MSELVRVSALQAGARIKYFGTEHVVQEAARWTFQFDQPHARSIDRDVALYRVVLRCPATNKEERIFTFGSDFVRVCEQEYELRVRTTRVGTVQFTGPSGMSKQEQLEYCWQQSLHPQEYESGVFVAGVVEDE